MFRPIAVILVVTAGAALAGCSSAPDVDTSKTPFASAVIAPVGGNSAAGTVAFTQQGTRVHVVIDLHGLQPGKRQAIHILEAFSCAALDSSALSHHFNPGNEAHGLPPDHRHAGDLGNVLVDSRGQVHHEMTVTNFLVSGDQGVAGRVVVVHSGMDSGAPPAGNAGTVVGCGVIQAR